MAKENVVTLEFHVSREARDRYQFDESLFALAGNVVFSNFHGARVFAQKINDKRDLVRFPEQTVRAGQINAMGLIDEILHFVAGLYREQKNRTVMRLALDWLHGRYGQEAINDTLRRFVDHFPPLEVYKGQIDAAAYLQGESAGVPHRQIVLEEMLMLWLANSNPAFSPFLELFDDTALEKETAYREAIAGLQEFFANQPTFGPDSQNLMEMLRSPAIAVPHSLSGQLAYILEKWGYLLDKHLYRLLGGLDFLKEEEKGALGGGPGRALVYQFAGQELELERFSQDKDWMPRLVLLAKNAYVWLDQLSKKYRREIRRLDQVPEEELDMLARWGFSGIWLIGLWERSRASQRIKQLCGNPEAVASAYSLYEYNIAGDLGGEEAFQNLRDRAWQRGLRLASDMVPNHMGIDSRWVVDHPDWFISLDYSPFPSYRFSGPDLSNDGRVGIFLEDHYYSRSDAAVVFKRVDRHTGSEKYIYHGNDGTSMPWNDTAQLNFLKSEVREAVIQTILHVARKFSVIRFDAAMTLARKHYQRLWFPEPGTGGAIPSRADHGLTREQFHALLPEEFWREVVDRIAAEVPDTLLLAEAFWLMEGYFVRTLGMHRVYNSAFMNMLKNEENANYRSVIKNTLEFDPEILKRFVNFMNNPDEETAVAQFGKGDKYFGVCTMMATLPGLPMFGHGQVDGLTEKYGMEYRRAYWDERPDDDLVRRHEREIFPLLRRRHLFAEARRFFLYDVFTPEGHVNEDVFAYSNAAGEEHVLVLYHNKYASARGWVRTSVGYSGKTGRGEERTQMQTTLGSALGLSHAEECFSIFRDHVTGLEYMRSSKELCDKGLYVELAAYKYHVFLDFREVRDNEWHQYAHLCAYLDGRGVPSISDALKEIFLGPLHLPFKELVNAPAFRQMQEEVVTYPAAPPPKALLDNLERKMTQVLLAVKQFGGGSGNEAALARTTREELEAALFLPVLDSRFSLPASDDFRELSAFLKAGLADEPRVWRVIFGWLFVHGLGRIANPEDAGRQSRSWMDEWLLGRILASVLRDLGLDEAQVWEPGLLIGLLTSQQRWFAVEGTTSVRAYRVVETLLKDFEGQQYLRVNRYQNILWYTGEALEHLLWWLFVVAVIQSGADTQRAAEEVDAEILHRYRVIRRLRAANRRAEHQVEKLLEAVKEETPENAASVAGAT
jgi:glycosidase